MSHMHRFIQLGTLVVLLGAPQLYAQGSLTPPGPPSPMMKTLDQVEARYPITVIPTNITVPGSYYLAANLGNTRSRLYDPFHRVWVTNDSLAGSDGITILTNDVTIDLNGFTLAGITNAGSGIAAQGALTNLVIRNGTVRNWGQYGIYLGESQTSIACGEVQGVIALGNGQHGISVGSKFTVRNCQASGNKRHGFYAERGSVISDCLAQDNGGHGISAASTRVLRCTASGNQFTGIDAVLYVSVEDCIVQDNRGYGISVYAYSPNYDGARVVRNLCLNNNVDNSSSGAGIFVNGARSLVEGNKVVGTRGRGIWVGGALAGSNNTIMRNMVSGFGGNNYVLEGSGNLVGPIVSDLTSANAWANISN